MAKFEGPRKAEEKPVNSTLDTSAELIEFDFDDSILPSDPG